MIIMIRVMITMITFFITETVMKTSLKNREIARHEQFLYFSTMFSEAIRGG